MSGVADLDRLDALLDEIQGIGTSTSPRSEVSNGDNNSNQYSGEEPVEEEPQEEDPEPQEEEPAEIPNVTSKTGTVKKRSGSSASSKGAKAKPSSSAASGSKSSKTGTTRSTSNTKKTTSNSTKRSSAKKPVAKTKSSSSLAKPVIPNVGDTHVIEVNGQKYDMSTVKIKRSAAPSTLKRTNTNSKPKVCSRYTHTLASKIR